MKLHGADISRVNLDSTPGYQVMLIIMFLSMVGIFFWTLRPLPKVLYLWLTEEQEVLRLSELEVPNLVLNSYSLKLEDGVVRTDLTVWSQTEGSRGIP